MFSKKFEIFHSGIFCETSPKVAKEYKVWAEQHRYGPHTIRLVPTGIHTGISITHEKTGDLFDLTDYDSI